MHICSCAIGAAAATGAATAGVAAATIGAAVGCGSAAAIGAAVGCGSAAAIGAAAGCAAAAGVSFCVFAAYSEVACKQENHSANKCKICDVASKNVS